MLEESGSLLGKNHIKQVVLNVFAGYDKICNVIVDVGNKASVYGWKK